MRKNDEGAISKEMGYFSGDRDKRLEWMLDG